MHALALARGAEQARRHGMERREFMASGLGVALSLSVMNLVNGCDGGRSGGFNVGGQAGNGEGGALDPQANPSAMPADLDPEACETALDHSDMFIFDIQTHRVETAPGIYRAFLQLLPQGMCGKGMPGCYSKDEYVRELFLESDTTMTVMSGIPAVDGRNPLTNDQIAETRDYVNGLADNTQRVITHAMVLPNYNHEAQLDAWSASSGSARRSAPGSATRRGVRATASPASGSTIPRWASRSSRRARAGREDLLLSQGPAAARLRQQLRRPQRHRRGRQPLSGLQLHRLPLGVPIRARRRDHAVHRRRARA